MVIEIEGRSPPERRIFGPERDITLVDLDLACRSTVPLASANDRMTKVGDRAPTWLSSMCYFAPEICPLVPE